MQNGCMTTYDYGLSTGEKISAYSRVFIGSTITMPVGQTLYNNNVGFDENAFNQNYVDSYYDNIVYKSGVYRKILTSDGMLMNTGTSSSPVYNRQYFLKDHLGNVRVVFDENGIVKQVSNYYPFGMEYGESAEDQTEMTYQDYQFGGKEFERDFELNMYDFGARNYDATVGRWTTMDPLAEKFPWQSPYAYCSNSPVNRIDPTGMADTPSSKDEWEKYCQAMAGEFDLQVSQTTGNPTTKTPYRSSTTTTSSNTKKNSKGKVSKKSTRKGSDPYQNGHGETIYTMDQFLNANINLTRNEIINQRQDRSITIIDSQPGGPDMRYVVNPNDGRVLDMRHMLVVGRQPVAAGILLEVFQWGLGNVSGMDPQDFYSNGVGYQFYMLNNSFINLIKPSTFTDQMRTFFNNPRTTYCW